MKTAISVTIERAAVDEAKAKIKSIRDLVPTPVVLTPDGIRSMAKSGPKSKAFVSRALEYSNNPTFALSLINPTEFAKGIAVAEMYSEVEAELEQLSTDVKSMVILSGSEAYSQALLLYKNLQMLSQQNVPGAKAAYEDLRSLYPGNSRTKGDNKKKDDDAK